MYLPNGNPKGTEKFLYKLEWMDRLNKYCRKALASEEEIIVLGDFNVIPQYNDCKDPTQWMQDALFDSQVRAKFHCLLHLGYLDAIRILDESNSIFTQWDYRDRAWEENNGVRIDHILLNPNAADRLEDSWIDSTLRGKAKPSDHVPVWASLNEK
ncbi:exodeoxyribonuclease III [Paracoccaceae bacterium]|nr:exodeoxyribonuclease III [Paracoccaceae bacterium]